MASDKDWRIGNQENYLKGKSMKRAQFNMTEDWDHEHCVFCWEKLRDKDIGYCTLDEYYWVCERCFEDFNTLFEWKLIE